MIPKHRFITESYQSIKDWSKIEDYVQQGLIRKQHHPTLPISIYNYSGKTQRDKLWSEYTIHARGLVLTDDYKIVAKPFSKFWNYFELGPDYKLPDEPFEITEKLDSSLIIITNYKGNYIFTTRGNFLSEQAIKAQEIFQKKYSYIKLKEDITLCCEVIFPENRKMSQLVVDYGDMEDLILLAIFDNKTGQEYPLPYNNPNQQVLPLVKKYDGITDFQTLINWKQRNFEGFVVRFQSGFRIKIKLEEYIKLHRIISGLSTTRIWEVLRSGIDFSKYIQEMPEEHADWANKVKSDLEAEYVRIEQKCIGIFNQLKQIKERKEFAKAAKEHGELTPVLFKMLDSKDYSDLIFKQIIPDLVIFSEK